jgi:hypothetical protein
MLLVILHAIVAGSVLAAAVLAPALIAGARPTPAATAAAIGAALVVTIGIALTVRLHGLPALRFVSLVPVIVGVALVLRLGAPVIDAKESARPLARELAQLELQRAPVAVFHARREAEYGLNFYRNQAMHNYERGEIPAEDHLLVAGRGLLEELRAMLPERRFSRLGGFEPQKLEIFWVSSPAAGHQHH